MVIKGNNLRKGKTTNKQKRNIKGGMIAALGVLAVSCGLTAMSLQAAEYTVKETLEVKYSCKDAMAYLEPDLSSVMITQLDSNLPVKVVGVTSNGWYQVDIGQICYIPSTLLRDKMYGAQVYTEKEIKAFTKGTYGVYDYDKLVAFTADDVEEMDVNSYIRYLDSFLLEKADIAICVLRENGTLLSEEYAKDAEKDEEIYYMSMKDYLAIYRNNYLDQSYWGPVATLEDLKLTLNRALRYGKDKFTTVYKDATIGSDKSKMQKLMEELESKMYQEQGMMFEYKMNYGTYQMDTGVKSSGWIIEFSRKTN